MNTSNNLIELKRYLEDFRDQKLRFSISGRNIKSDLDIIAYMVIFYIFIELNQIDSVFGHMVSPTTLYGGRYFNPQYALTDEHVHQLEKKNIGLALTLSNHFFYESDYANSYALLEKYHKKGNSVICTNDKLARRLKQDFPNYEIKASMIKNLNTIHKIKDALKLYDSVTLPMDKNGDDDLLNNIEDKDRIILFGNAGCAYNCPDRACFLGFSQVNRGMPITSKCSKSNKFRQNKGLVYFNVKKLLNMGYSRFKLVPMLPGRTEEVVQAYDRLQSSDILEMGHTTQNPTH